MMPTGKEIIDAIIKADCVRADEDEPSILIWDACAEEQIEAALAEILKGRDTSNGTPRDLKCDCAMTINPYCILHGWQGVRLQ